MTTHTQSAVALEHLEKLHPVRAYSVPQICELAGVGRTHLYAQIKEGKLKALKCGRRTIVLDEELRRWLGALPTVAVMHPAEPSSSEPV